MSENITPLSWIEYAKERPETRGVYEWRIPSVALEGEKVIVAAHMRTRGAGYEEVLSPSFDHWDGYRVSVPKGLEWREAAPENADVKHYEQRLLGIDGLDHILCPYCEKVPRLKGIQRLASGGTLLRGDVQGWNKWWLDCCEWGHTPHLADPREIERIRRASIGPALTARVKELEKLVETAFRAGHSDGYDDGCAVCDGGTECGADECWKAFVEDHPEAALNKEPT